MILLGNPLTTVSPTSTSTVKQEPHLVDFLQTLRSHHSTIRITEGLLASKGIGTGSRLDEFTKNSGVFLDFEAKARGKKLAVVEHPEWSEGFERDIKLATRAPHLQLITMTSFGCNKCVDGLDALDVLITLKHEREDFEYAEKRKMMLDALCKNPPPLPPPMRIG